MKFLTIVTAATLASSIASAAEIDFSQVVPDQDGKPFTECVVVNKADPNKCDKLGDVTLGRLAFTALNVAEQGASPAEVVKRGTLALKVYRAKKLDVTADEIQTMKDALGKRGLTPVALIQASAMLDRSAGAGK